MNTDLTNPQQPAPQTSKPTDTALQRATQIAAAVDAVYEKPTSYNNPDLPSWQDGTRIGTTPPVDQPGRAAMSGKAVDDTARMIGGGFLLLCAGGAVSGVMHFSSQADPTVIGLMAAVPASLAVPILALSRLVKRAKQVAEAAPPVIHQHYNGTVHQDQRQAHTKTVAVLANTRNQLPK
ncbi:hypothetical protein [Streptomyces sp. NPDC007991]|uniref:hypothetical protein n=1 Tax=Streptomyces sp. NPDC007991 TaxID=3364803 RepID=UPI0036E82E37